MVGSIYASDALEVRLPLTASQLAYLDIPGAAGAESTASNASSSKVELRASVGNVEQMWEGRIVRSEGIDTLTQQLHVVAQIDNVQSDSGEALRVGQYVTATLTAEKLENVYVLPRGAVREDREIVVVDDEGLLLKVPVTVAWNDDELSAIKAGGKIPDSPVVVTTVLGTVIDGTKVRATIDGKAPPPPKRPSGNAGNASRGQGAADGKPSRPAADGAGKSGKPAGRPQTNSQSSGESAPQNDQRARFTKWRDIIESGGTLPEEDKQQIRERIASGGRVPPWLRAAVE